MTTRIQPRLARWTALASLPVFAFEGMYRRFLAFLARGDTPREPPHPFLEPVSKHGGAT